MIEESETQATYLSRDHGRRHPSDSGTQPEVDGRILEEATRKLEEAGFAILRGLVTPEQAAAIRDELSPQLVHCGRNAIEGHKTQRLYGVVSRTRSCDFILEHSLLLGLADRILQPDYLLSQAQVIRVLPGETAQPLHHDDSPYPGSRPRGPLTIGIMVALDPFTEANGGTVVFPGSHRWDDRSPRDDDPRHAAVLSPGDAVFFLGTLWHGAGANRTNAPRTGLHVQLCQPWLRTQENYALSVPRDRVREASSHLQRLLGYSIYRPFFGAVDGMHPKRLLTR